MAERKPSDQNSVGSSQNRSDTESNSNNDLFNLNENQKKVLRALCGVLIGELDRKKLEILLKTKSSVVQKDSDLVKEFGRFDLSQQDDIIDRLTQRLLKSTPPYKLRQINSILKRLSSKGMMSSVSNANKPFYEMTQEQREIAFIKWSTSQNTSTRNIFKIFSFLICSTFWLNPYGFNPAIGYTGTDPYANSPELVRTYPEFDFLEITDNNSEIKKFDTIIIGSGAGGSVAAARLSRMGYKILVIEKGHHYKQSELSLDQKDGYDKLYEYSGGLLSDDNGLHVLAGSNFGGGTTVGWSATMEPQFFVREEWAKKFELPYFMEDEYGLTMKYINARLGTSTTNVTHNKSNQTLIDGCKKLGLQVNTVPQNTASFKHECGWCSFGCKYGIKQSSVMTWLSEAKSNGAEFLQDCYVEKILFEKDGKNPKVTGVEVIANGIKNVKIHAKRVIVASGAIHTPALLLRSGLKNKNIGKNLHVHPTAAVYGVFPDKEIKTYSGTIMSAISSAFDNVDGENYGANIVVGSHHPSLMFANFPWKSSLQHKQLMLEYNHIVPLMIVTRDRDGSKITIDAEGNPILEYNLSPHDSKSMISGLLAAIKILVAAGASKIGTCQVGVEDYIVEKDVNPFNDIKFTLFLEKVKKVGISENQAYLSSIEQMSTCRMGSDPSKSVINPVGETWEVENLYVADASALPTATGVPSMLTVMNVAHYISKCILEKKNYIKKKRVSILRSNSIKELISEDKVSETEDTNNKEKRKSKRLSLSFSFK